MLTDGSLMRQNTAVAGGSAGGNLGPLDLPGCRGQGGPAILAQVLSRDRCEVGNFLASGIQRGLLLDHASHRWLWKVPPCSSNSPRTAGLDESSIGPIEIA